MFDSNDVEELIYTIYTFETAAADMEMPWYKMGSNFAKLLSPCAYRKWDKMCQDYNNKNNQKYTEDQDGYKLQRRHFLQLYVMDPDAKGTQIDAIIDGEWRKTKEASIEDHRERFV